MKSLCSAAPFLLEGWDTDSDEPRVFSETLWPISFFIVPLINGRQIPGVAHLSAFLP